MPRIMKTAAFVFGGLIIIVLLIGWLFAMLAPGCEDTTCETLFSPDRSHKVILYTRNCGATTGFSTHIALAKSDEDINDGTTIFVADDGYGEANLHPVYQALIDIRARWIDNHSLELSYERKARLFTEKVKADGITIIHRKR
ncbi:hypothetical protein GCM10007423_58490 [Dyadobacter endophyticus]|uniref:Uncharacterized protein n=2 Tax=Dyadobacter endophyticus TaxID=1749036 RepID=A0ABQ1ZA42_9BACT|nr:hypothetical protein GCM10007423_58490 [Dyadobacter endophyticus]